MQWLVAACCVHPDFLASPGEFLANPSSRTQTTWACGVVNAVSKDEALDAGLKAWDEGSLAGQMPGDEFINWYAAPLA